MDVPFMGFADIKNPYQYNKHVAKIKAIGQIKSLYSHLFSANSYCIL